LFKDKGISILEIGFGTGLNAFITYLQSIKSLTKRLNMLGRYPITAQELEAMNYVQELKAEHKKIF
jgi:tRNA U34 5-methylaminomethyl-2-thiouridine-forming methyltransferase MnmC